MTDTTEPSRNDSETETEAEAEPEWKLAQIRTQDHGPRYVIGTDGDAMAADTVRFNGFKVGLDGRIEVEYTELEVTDEGYPAGTVADFYAPAARGASPPTDEEDEDELIRELAADLDEEEPTHDRLVCPACKSTVLVPVGNWAGSSADERVYCECDGQGQGYRMHTLPGPAGEVSL